MDGHRERQWLRARLLSRTPSTEAVIITYMRDVKEGRCVRVTDVPGVFLQCDSEGGVFLQIEGNMVQALLKIEPGLYRKYIVMNNGKRVLYMRLRKALYGLLNSGLIF